MRFCRLFLPIFWLSSAVAAGADRIYFFVDEQGVPHFSNVPADPRYKPIEQGGRPIPLPARATPAVSAPPPLAAQPPVPDPVLLPADEGEDTNDR
jgi:hypothetical protein